MNRPGMMAAVWFLAGVLFIAVGATRHPRGIALIVIGVAFLLIGIATVLRRGNPPPPPTA